jgi:DNA-binding beta-propeller fold protein YncE
MDEKVEGSSPSQRAPISTTTNRPGTPIHIALGLIIALTPDGKTLYAVAWDKIVPISTATNTPGKPIPVRYGQPDEIVVTP